MNIVIHPSRMPVESRLLLIIMFLLVESFSFPLLFFCFVLSRPRSIRVDERLSKNAAAAARWRVKS